MTCIRGARSFELASAFSRHAVVAAGDDSIVWTGDNLRPTRFGLEQESSPEGSFLMRGSLP
ncbi:MAG TPA: hypothetical protein VFN67_34755 [Polyangiales bacterium]|nr:hypothetical protein [Polyangiales bacterium]